MSKELEQAARIYSSPEAQKDPEHWADYPYNPEIERAVMYGAEWQFERIVKWLEDNLCEEVNLHLVSYAEAKYVTDNIIGGLKRAFREEKK